jgi:hypothetical protein
VPQARTATAHRSDPASAAGILAVVGSLALKEWAVVVRALLAGEQILDVRKGGLREDGRHFGLHGDRFWLYPTYEHQRAELVKPAYRRWVPEPGLESSDHGPVRLEGWAEVVGVVTVTEPEELARLGSKLVWTDDYAASRLRWKRRDPLWLLALRAHRVDEPITASWRDRYAGCTSWVDLDEVPDPGAVASEPAVSDENFTARLGLIERELGRSFGPSAVPAS